MSSIEEYLFKELFEGANWLETKGILHIDAYTTGKPGHWVAHPFCGRRAKGWIGFSELRYAKVHYFCDTCLMLFAITKLGNKLQVKKVALNNRQEKEKP